MFKMWGFACSEYPKKIIITYFITTSLLLLFRHHLKMVNVKDFVKDLDESTTSTLIVLSLFFGYKRIENVASSYSKVVALIATIYTLAVYIIFSSTTFYLLDLRGKQFPYNLMVIGYVIDHKKCISLLRSSVKDKNIIIALTNLTPEVTLNTLIACFSSSLAMHCNNTIITTFSFYLFIGTLTNFTVWLVLYPTALNLLLRIGYFKSIYKIKNLSTSKAHPWNFAIKVFALIFLSLALMYIHKDFFKKPVTTELSEVLLYLALILSNSFILRTYLQSINKFKEKRIKVAINCVNPTEELFPEVYLQRNSFLKNPKILEVLKKIPHEHYDYSKVFGVCCENVIGYIPMPLGIVGPLVINDDEYFVPLATTEGCLVASTSRGCRALLENGVTSKVFSDGMTRGPVLRFETGEQALNAWKWIELNFDEISLKFDNTSRFVNLLNIQKRIFGRLLFLRFIATTGDAMGMNMVSKATEVAIKYITKNVVHAKIVSLSGNFCTDKKSASINWVLGRGKGVFAEAVIKGKTIRDILKTTAKDLVDINTTKNLIGTAAAGGVGGYNAHASNVVTAIFIATGQDIAQNIVSSNCITIMELQGDDDLYVSCTLPSLEVGTVGGGTELGPQSACLELLGIKGGNEECPGANSKRLAEVISATVLAAEISLLSALVKGTLVKSHLKLNRRSK